MYIKYNTYEHTGKVIGAVLRELRLKAGIVEEAEKPAAPKATTTAAAGGDEESDEEEEEGDEDQEEEEATSSSTEEEDEEEKEAEALDATLSALLETLEEAAHVTSEESTLARQEYNTIYAEQRELDTKIIDLENVTGGDYGDDYEFFAMRGKCFSKTVNQYDYEMCPYKEAQQKEGGHSYGTKLGKWSGLERVNGSADGRIAPSYKFLFTDGQQCWNGPKRSLTVFVVCGVEDEVTEVDEPNMCEYTMQFRTPAACTLLPDHLWLDLDEEEEGEEQKGSARAEL